MAEPLKFETEAAAQAGAHEELERLLQSLYESGGLTLVNAVVGQFTAITELLVDQLNTEPGRNVSNNLSVLAASLSILPPDAMHAVVKGIADGLELSAEHALRRPPGLLKLIGALRHQDTRRGLSTLVNILQAMGRQLRHAERARPVLTATRQP